MSDRNPRTNKFLILAAVILCIFCGVIFTRSSANPSSSGSGSSSDLFVSEKPAPTKTAEKTDTSAKESVTPTPTPTGKSSSSEEKTSDKAASYKVSAEAKKGVWTSNGSSWMFLVDGVPYTGWLNDSDGKRYFFNKEGIMQTGWLDNDGKRYYLNLDGIMQTGDITIKKKTYHLNSDGSLKGYKASSKKETSKKETSEKNAEKASKKASSKAKKTIALTFDDGPSSFTDRLLDCLEENNAKATFFMVGQEISSFPDTVKRMASLGCELGNHTYSHKELTTLDADGIVTEINKTNELLTELTGAGASVIRPPYGSVNDTVRASVESPMILWSVDTLDWKTLDTQQTVDAVMESAQDGAIILMHDIYSTTVDAAEIIIPKLIEEGYELVTIHELAKSHDTELKAGITYGSMNQD